MRNFFCGIVFSCISILIFNSVSDQEVFIRHKLDKEYFVEGIPLNYDCWTRCLHELMRINGKPAFRNIRMVVAEVTMESGGKKQSFWHAVIGYETPLGNTIYYDPMNGRQVTQYRPNEVN